MLCFKWNINYISLFSRQSNYKLKQNGWTCPGFALQKGSSQAENEHKHLQGGIWGALLAPPGLVTSEVQPQATELCLTLNTCFVCLFVWKSGQDTLLFCIPFYLLHHEDDKNALILEINYLSGNKMLYNNNCNMNYGQTAVIWQIALLWEHLQSFKYFRGMFIKGEWVEMPFMKKMWEPVSPGRWDRGWSTFKGVRGFESLSAVTTQVSRYCPYTEQLYLQCYLLTWHCFIYPIACFVRIISPQTTEWKRVLAFSLA